MLSRVFHIKPPSLTTLMINLPHEWCPYTRSCFVILWSPYCIVLVPGARRKVLEKAGLLCLYPENQYLTTIKRGWAWNVQFVLSNETWVSDRQRYCSLCVYVFQICHLCQKITFKKTIKKATLKSLHSLLAKFFTTIYLLYYRLDITLMYSKLCHCGVTVTSNLYWSNYIEVIIL